MNSETGSSGRRVGVFPPGGVGSSRHACLRAGGFGPAQFATLGDDLLVDRDNGLSFTAAAEAAGARRSGAAIGFQQTVLAIGGLIIPIWFAALVSSASWRVVHDARRWGC